MAPNPQSSLVLPAQPTSPSNPLPPIPSNTIPAFEPTSVPEHTNLPTPDSTTGSRVAIYVPILATLVVLIFIAGIIVCCCVKRKRRNRIRGSNDNAFAAARDANGDANGAGNGAGNGGVEGVVYAKVAENGSYTVPKRDGAGSERRDGDLTSLPGEHDDAPPAYAFSNGEGPTPGYNTGIVDGGAGAHHGY